MVEPIAPDPVPAPDPVDMGLAAGFGPSHPESTGASILAALAQRRGAVPRVLLRDATAPATPLLRPLPAADRTSATGRYQFQGEIARGGIGVILKGHDQDLGRDVAIKVLHERYGNDTSLLHRFVEEAQIGGQLQHPGIAPVYELGLHEGRPFFSMKLIQGRTLAALLAERVDAGQDRRRFLGIFEQVCLTVAYAHARGVVHRDLKPANVMVGSFGEVQVVDWGMAKVLAQGGVADEGRRDHGTIETVRSGPGTPPGTGSVAGSVMGTPSYMPPEQARGDVAQVDERSDVFALGALLCEILTGQPPYAGGRDEALARAAQGDPAGVRERLTLRAVEPDLAALVCECLAVSPSARPRNGEAVVDRLRQHLAAVDARAQAAHIEAAEARVTMRAERRARRLTLSLATAVLALAGLGGGGWLWLDSQATSRARDTARAVSRSLADTALARGREDWGAARAALGRAEAHLEAGAPDADLSRQLESVRAEVDGEVEAAARQQRLLADNRALLDALADARQPEGQRPADWARLDGDYRAILAARGCEVDAADQAGLAATLCARGIAVELAAFLDDWSIARQKAGNAAGAARLSSLASALDPDAVRRELRVALHANDTAGLQRLATTELVAVLPATTLRLLGAALGQQGQGDQAAAILLAGRLRFPRDFALAMHTGRQMLGRGRASEAGTHYSAALALRPDSPEAWRALALAFSGPQSLDRALELLDFACRQWPDDAHMHFHRAEMCRRKGDRAEAIAALRRAVDLKPAMAEAHNNLGELLHEQRDFAAAVRHLRRAVDLDPGAHTHYNLGTALMDLPDPDGAIVSLRKAVELDPRLVMAHNHLGLSLKGKGQLDEAIDCFRKAVAIAPQHVASHCNLGNTLRLKKDLSGAAHHLRKARDLLPGSAVIHSNLGLVLEEQRDFAGAAACHRTAIELDAGQASAHFNLGNALFRQNDIEGAVQCFRRAIELEETDAKHHCNLGVALTAKGDHDGAGASYRRAAQLGMNAPALLDAAAWWLVTREGSAPADAAEAVRYARQAATRLPKDAACRRTLGVALYRAGELEAAVEALEQSLRDDARVAGPAGVLFLAMAKHRLGLADAARRSYDQAAPLIAANATAGDELTGRILREATQVLGIAPEQQDR